MSIRKAGRAVKEHPTGVGIIKTGAAGPQSMTCPTHKLACAPEQTATGRVWRCPRGHVFTSTPMR